MLEQNNRSPTSLLTRKLTGPRPSFSL